MARTRVRAGLAIVAIVVAGLAVLGDSTTENTPTKVGPNDTGLASASSNDTKPPPVFAVGDDVKLGQWQVKVYSVTDPLPANDIFKPRAGNRFIGVDAEVTNNTAKPQTVSALLCFELQDDSNRSYDLSFGGDTSVKSLDGEVDAHGKRRGELTYEVPRTATGLKLRFKCELFSSGSAIIALS